MVWFPLLPDKSNTLLLNTNYPAQTTQHRQKHHSIQHKLNQHRAATTLHTNQTPTPHTEQHPTQLVKPQ